MIYLNRLIVLLFWIVSTSYIHAQEWVKEPSLGDQGQAIACLVVKGKSSPFRLHYFGIVPQYGSWNGVWERVRPSSFNNDDGVGFLTRMEIEELLKKMVQLGWRPSVLPAFETVEQSFLCSHLQEEFSLIPMF